PGQMRAAIALRNVVGEALDVLRVGVVPLHRHFDRRAVLLADRMEYFGMQHRLAAIHVFDEAADAAGIGEVLALAIALVDELDLRPVVEERELADALRQDVVVAIAPSE